jgi:hypothetical protein
MAAPSINIFPENNLGLYAMIFGLLGHAQI